MAQIEAIIRSIAGLKPISHVVHKVMALSEDPDSSMEDLVKVITYDAITTANVLKVANSAYYACPTRFDSVNQAAVYLGMDEIVDLVLLTNCTGHLNRPQKGYGHADGELWRYSVCSALLARKLAAAAAIEDTSLIFTAALLKDIGKVVMEQYVEAHFEKITDLVENKSYTFREAEKAVLGIDHAELGAIVAKNWYFTPEMVEMIAHHHQPENARHCKKETAIVHIADMICAMMGAGNGRDVLSYRFHLKSIQSLGDHEMDLASIIADYAEIQKKVDDLIA